MDYQTLRYKRDGHVTVLTYDRPEQRNAVSRQMNRELHHVWQRFRDAKDEFVLVITGEGDAFCAGWDLQDAAELGEGPKPDWDEFKTSVFNTPGECGYTRRVDVFKPVIAAVNGWAVAAGLENALLADIRIAAENAVFGALERALELAHQIAELAQGAIRSDKETMVRNVGRTYEEQLRQEAENALSMFARRDSHAIGARAFKEGRTPEWPHHGL